MSFADEYNKLRNERIEQQEKAQRRASGQMSFADEYLELREQRERQQATKKRKKSNFLDSVKTVRPVTTAPVKSGFGSGDAAERIAKAKEKKKEEEKTLSFFDKGAFEDGRQRGDLVKTILGTTGDVGLNVAKGAGGLVEGLFDALDYGVAGVADFLGADKAAESLRTGAKENRIDKWTKGASEKLDESSVLGRTSESVAQSLGQIGGIILTGGAGAAAGFGAAGTTLLTSGVMGASSAGSGMSEAYAEGATDEEAATYGLIKGVVDAGSEMIFGGLGKTVKAIGLSKGLSSLDDIFAKKLTNKIADQTAKNFIQFGVKASAEGVEEVLAGLGTAVGKKLTYMSEKELKELIDNEDLLEQFVVGAVTSGIAQSGIVPGMQQGSLREANKTGTDFISGLTENEQKVVDAEFEKRTEGKDLTKKEQNKIYEDVLDDMAKGRISTDAIESVLGGESYQAYKNAVSKEEDAIKELSELYKGDELLQQIEDFKKASESNQLKSQLGESVYGLVKDSRLAESYNEKSRRSQAFQADVSKYDEKQKAIVQKAIDSGVLNNTNKTHEFVDLIAKIAADKDMTFDFVNNAKLKESGFAIDGKTVNGFVTKDGISINIDSAKSLDTVIGHEITHVLEGTELYNELKQTLFDYAKSKKAKGDFANEYMERLYNARQLYKDIDGYKGAEGFERIKNEVVADLVGDYIFTDTDFVRRLSAENRNVFQKIFDEIKYLCKIATTGSKEAKELEKVKRAFEQVYRESSKATAKNGEEVKYSISGQKAKTANYLKLDEAIKMEEVGKATSEEIRQQTGWFRGYDGKWRFEISDRDMEFNIGGFFTNPDVIRYKELEKKLITDPENMTDAEESELRSLSNALKGVKKSPKNLGDYIKHDKLFEAYPQLKDIRLRFDYLSNGERGAYDGNKNEIVLNYGLREDKAKLEDTLIHEIQHAVQSIEGFATGSSPEYWKNQRRDIIDTIGLTPLEQYQNTAGEIEARDVTSRRWRSEEALREHRPDIDRTDVLFANARYSVSNTDNKYVGKFLASELRLEAPAEVAEKGAGPVKETAKQNTAQPTPAEKQQIAKILSEEPTKSNRKNRNWAMFKAAVLDKGAVFEDLSFKTKNRSLMEKWNYILSSEGRAQHLIGNGDKGVKSLVEILDNVQDNELAFAEYLYHKHNIDRMTLEERFEGATNKAVFGDAVTAAESREMVRRIEKDNPEFKKYSEDVYKYNRHLRQLLVEGGVISQETADLWEKMYPHYVPISRVMENGASIYVPLDSRRTGVNAPIKKAKGGNQDMRPVYTVMASRTLQTFKAIAKNNFGIELKNTLQSAIGNEVTQVDDVLNSLSDEEALLQKAKNGKNPTFTVFENGERVTFEVSEDMYDALKPVSEKLAMTIKPLNVASKLQRGLLTEYNPVFMLTNAIKDAQDVLINSQHPVKTYAKMPEAFKQIVTEGYWYKEYMKSGGEDNTYFNKQTGELELEKKGAAKILESFPFNIVSTINNVIERIPRLAEYIASREAGKSVEGAMLDAARVTTNFAAGGDFAKFLNRNGATFLNASIQGAMQQARNVREANANGFKGWVGLATRFAMAGIPALILNNLVWDDDEEYEELSDYVKQNYYVVYKTDDGRFIRIPKGRTLAVIQNAIEQIANAATGDDEVDLAEFLKLAVENLAPNNPMDNNVLSPVTQVLANKTWYGEELVPTRLQDLPAAEQFDESTDSLSKWLGEKLDISPYKINYLLDQYSGGIGDVLLPMMTPEAESGDTSRLGQLIAPLRDKFTTDATFNNQNVSDFYDKVEELTTNAKASAATDEDILKNKYMNAVNSEVSDLYKKKREIQNSNLSDTAKYKQVKDVQKQITDIMRDALGTYDNIRYENGKEFAIIGDTYFQWYKPEDGDAYWRKLSEDQVTKHKVTYAAGDVAYATNGKVHYRLNEGGDWRNMSDWTKISDKDLARQKEVTKELGITPEEYWGKTEVSYFPMKEGEYEYAYENPENYAVAKAVGGYDAYKGYSKDLYNLKADKDANGKSISGSRKKKVAAYINNLNIDYGEKLILYKSEYPSDDRYNYEIIEYLNNNDDISYDDMVKILTELSFKVDGKGNISWD